MSDMVRLRHPKLKGTYHTVSARMVDAWVAVGWVAPTKKVSRPATARAKKVTTK